MSFVVLDDNCKIVIQSSDNNSDLSSHYYKSLFSQKSLFNNKSGTTSFESEDKFIQYSHYRKIDGYNYTILTGLNKSVINKSFYQTLLPRLFEFVGLGLFFLVMLYIFRRYIISPVSKLAYAADKISQGVTIKKVPRGTSKETAILANYRALTPNTLECVKLALVSSSDYKSQNSFLENINEEMGNGDHKKAHLFLLDEMIKAIAPMVGYEINQQELDN